MSLPLQVFDKHNRVANYSSPLAEKKHKSNGGLVDQRETDKGTFTIHRWRQFVKMFSLIAIPLLGIIATTSIKLNEAAEINAVSQISRSTILGKIAISNLVANLQLEQGFSAIVISSNGTSKNMLTELTTIQAKTNGILFALTEWPPADFISNKTLTYSRQVFPNRLLRQREDLYAVLTWHRTRVTTETRDIRFEDNIEFYTHINEALMDWSIRNYILPRNSRIWSNLLSMDSILRVTDVVGTQRALGSTFYIQCDFIKKNKQWFLFLDGTEEAFLNRNAEFCTFCKSMRDRLLSLKAPLASIISRMKRQIHNSTWTEECKLNYARERKLNESQFWFNQMTEYINVYIDVSSAVRNTIILQLQDMEVETRSNLISYASLNVVVTVLSLILGGWYAVTINKMIATVTAYADQMNEETSQLEEKKKQSEILLLQLLPRCVADELMQSVIVPAENFDSVSIFFSDIVSFTVLASSIKPMEVVELLNGLYNLFDTTIEKYDAYKVETIGDAYMIASGVPTRNGLRHASILCDMALELQKEVMKFSSTGLKVGQVKIRCGIHTGPCVAGVVGVRMPRYCIFGQTVSIANKMESSGAATRVQISQSTYLTLSQSGNDFAVEPNMDMLIPLRGRELTLKTYWVHGRLDAGNTGRLPNVG